MDNVPTFEDILQLNVFFYDFVFLDRERIGELAREVVKNMTNASSFYVTTITLGTSTTSTTFSKFYGVVLETHCAQIFKV